MYWNINIKDSVIILTPYFIHEFLRPLQCDFTHLYVKQ